MIPVGLTRRWAGRGAKGLLAAIDLVSKREVVRVTQSPMNKKRWCLEMSCGHEVWVTRTRKPTIKTLVCNDCAKKAAEEMKKELRNDGDGDG
jgi:hypothetical protein